MASSIGFPSIIVEMTSRVPRPDAFENQAYRASARSGSPSPWILVLEFDDRRQDCVVQGGLQRVLKLLRILGHICSYQFERWFRMLIEEITSHAR